MLHTEGGCKVLLSAFPAVKPYLEPICGLGDSHPRLTIGLAIGIALLRRASKPIGHLFDSWWEELLNGWMDRTKQLKKRQNTIVKAKHRRR